MRKLRPTDYVKITGHRLRDLKKVKAAKKRIEGQPCWFCGNPESIAGPAIEIQLNCHSRRAVPVVSLCEQCRADLKRGVDALVASGGAALLPVFP